MTDSDELKIVIRAVDEASKVLKDVKKQLGGTSDEVQKYGKNIKSASAGSSELHKEWQKLFSTSKYLEEGLQDLRRTLTSMLWSNVALAVSSVAIQMISWVMQAGKAKETSEELTRTIQDQAREWGLLPEKMKGATNATIEVYNAQLKLAQFKGLGKDKELEARIEQLVNHNKELERYAAAAQRIPEEPGEHDIIASKWAVDYNGQILKNDEAIALARRDLENWRSLMGMTTTTLSGVSKNLSDTNKNIRDKDEALLKQTSDLELQIVRLRDGEEAYLIALKNRLILQGNDANQIDQLIAKMRELHQLQLLSQIKLPPQKPEFLINPPAGPVITKDEFESLNRRNELMNEYNRLQNDTILGMNGRIVAAAALQDITIDEMQQMLLSNEAMKVQNALYQAGVSAVAQAILGQQQLGKALKAALAQTLAQIAAESAIQTIFETAKGFAALYLNPPAAAAHFKAAAQFAATAAAAGVAARTFSRGVDKGSYSSAGSTGSITSQQSQPAPQKVQIIVHGNIVDHAAFVRELQPYFKEVTIDTV